MVLGGQGCSLFRAAGMACRGSRGCCACCERKSSAWAGHANKTACCRGRGAESANGRRGLRRGGAASDRPVVLAAPGRALH